MYRLRVTYRKGSSTNVQTVMADGNTESAAKAALVRQNSSYSDAIILKIEMA
jgi:hypothetical protein